MDTYFVAFFGAALAALVTIPPLSRLAVARGLTDKPGLRKVHAAPVPRLGGIGIVVGVVLLSAYFLLTPVPDIPALINREILAVLAGALAVAAIGLTDDVRSLSSRIKLLVQIAAAVLVCWAGVLIRRLDFGVGAIDLGWAAWPVTMLWIVGVTNAMNMIDGLDSLSGGIAAIACGALAIVTAINGQIPATIIMLAALGGLTGFLFFNFHPAKIFMGDGGTYFTGFLLSTISVHCSQKPQAGCVLLAAAMALGVPLLDMTLAVTRRALQRRSITSPDRGHIHHRLLDKGLTHMRAVLVLHVVTLVTASLGVCIALFRQALLPLAALAAMVLLTAFSLAVDPPARHASPGEARHRACAAAPCRSEAPPARAAPGQRIAFVRRLVAGGRRTG